MKFGEIPIASAEGAILAHSVKHKAGMFRKGRVLSATDIALLAECGVAQVFAARLSDDDVPEDKAAEAVAKAIAGEGTVVQAPFTGRANLHARQRGLVVIDQERVRDFNRVHESLTLATSAPFEIVEERQMVATVKVIPFAVPRDMLEEGLSVIGADPLIRVESFKHRRAGLIITRLPQTKPSLIAKSEEAIRGRIAELDGTLAEVTVVEHAVMAVGDAVAKLHAKGLNPILIFGASAIVDRGDVIPAALEKAQGEVVHLGMPVDPGNLMMFGRLEGAAVIGVPSCARSPKLNGFDWVLARIMAGLHVSGQDIMDMGAGGLLKEIPSRPSPREGEDAKSQRAPKIAGIILAAGRSTRMGANKLMSIIGDRPMVRMTAEALLASAAGPVLVVTGHERERVEAALQGLDVRFVHNPAYASGLASSLKAGLAAVPQDAEGAVVALGDMPLVSAQHIDRLISAFSPAEKRTIIVPVHAGERGNPVLWGREHFAEMLSLDGDRGAKVLMEASEDHVTEIAMRSDAVLADFDTPEALARLTR
ncbi:NTP transferase domain-containing protein [Taklimakanibacter lacteus]|uniref:NTP transferase domain-containing protein n=1 Tax=Taklimakanibacter lacteus TaxID=2268456 RepID=UPI000E66F57E